MTSKKARQRDRRANERLRAQAQEELRAGRPDRARRLLERAIARHPANARFWFDLGRLEAGEGDRGAALRALERALELSPTYTRARRALVDLGGTPPPPPPQGPGSGPSATALEEPPEAPESTLLTDAYPWESMLADLKRIGGVRLASLATPQAVGELDRELRERPGRPLEEGMTESLLDGPPDSLLALTEELVYRGRVLNRDLRALLSGPTPPAPPRALGAASVISTTTSDVEFLWPSPFGQSPFPLEVALPLSGPLNLEFSDAVGGKKGRLRRPLALDPGDAALICAGERAVHIGGVWGRQGMRVHIGAGRPLRILRLRVG